MVATRGGGQTPRKLKFHEKLVGKGLSTDALLKKLKTLQAELAEMDQDRVDLNSLAGVRKELISTSILLHKDKGVKAYAACCMADLLKLYAPDAPYLPHELKDMFQFFFRQLMTGLKVPDSPYFNQYFHLLHSLASFKSVVLVCDLPAADELMTEIFRGFFDLIRGDLAKHVELCMVEILVALIEEAQTLPSEVLSTILAQFVSKSARVDHAGHRLAVQVCNGTADRLQKNVCQYFTDILLQHTRAEEEDEEDLDDVRTAHNLIKQLYTSCPALLLNVISLLEQELRVEDLEVRLLGTQVLGEMFADKGGRDLAQKYPTTWTAWLARKNDKAMAVRLAFVEATKGILTLHAQMREEVEEALAVKLLDPEEKVRAAVCKVYAQLDYETALHHVSEPQLRLLAERCKDKKSVVRNEALASLGKLYRLAYPEIENEDDSAVKQFAWIPQEILYASTVGTELKASAEQVIAQYVLPLPTKGDDEVAWTEQLLTVMRYLDDRAVTVLLGMTGLRAARPTVYERFLQSCIENNGGVIDENEAEVKRKLGIVIKQISSVFPDPAKAETDLNNFAKANENRLYKLLKTSMDPQTDLKTLVKSHSEFIKRVEQMSSSLLTTTSTLLRRASFWVVGQSSVPTLIKRVRKGGENAAIDQIDPFAKNAQTLLACISKNCPALFRSHMSELAKAITEDKNPKLVEVALQALAAVVKWDPTLAPTDKRTLDKAMRYVKESNPRHAKFAARLLAHSKNHEEVCSEIVESVAGGLEQADESLLLAYLAVLTEFARSAIDAFETKSEVIVGFLIKQVLMRPSPIPENAMETDDEWAEEDSLPPLAKAKIAALKACTRRCIAHASSESALDVAAPVMKLLFTILEHSGSVEADAQDDPTVKSRLRLQAAFSLLQLATVEVYRNAITPNFTLLAITMQDPCFQVREAFLRKLISYLESRKLNANYNVIPFMTAHDPEHDIRQQARLYVARVLARAPREVRIAHFELIFLRFLHLLAHHPDFAINSESLQDISKYIEFYLDQVATADNISLLYLLAQKLKGVRDAASDAVNENLYAVSELAQLVMNARAKFHSWSIINHPAKVRLPADLFKPLPSPEAVKQVFKTVYVPDEMVTWVSEVGKPVKSPTSKKRTAAPKVPQKRKASGAKTNGSAKRSRPSIKRRRKEESDEEDEDDDDDDDDEEEDQEDEAEDHGSKIPSSEGALGPRSSPTPQSSDNEDENEEETTELGRGARGRAKARAMKKAKKAAAKSKSKERK